MPKISSYNTVTPQGTDKIIISQENGAPTDVTKNITVDGIKEYIVSGLVDIPKPYIYTLKNTSVPTLEQQKVCIQKPIETDWLTKNPRLFLYRYKKTTTTKYDSVLWKKRGFVHPSHQNGAYQQTNFPGSNWASAPLVDNGANEIHPIDTEWDINTELKIAKTGSTITDFASLRQSTYIEIPFSKLQFLYNRNNPSVPYTSFPVTTGNPNGFCTIAPKNGRLLNTNTPFNENLYTKVILKFAIGIPNPTWTNTNHELPYIMGELSNPVQMVYQRNILDNGFSKAVISQGSNATVSRGVSN